MLTQGELGERAGLSLHTVHAAEHGRGVSPKTGRALAEALGVEPRELLEDVEDPKVEAPPSVEPSLFNGIAEERRFRYLRGWRAFVHRIAGRWEKEPPKTSAELSPLFDAMTALMEQGVFDVSDATDLAEVNELMLFMGGIERLNRIADAVEGDEEAEQRRATFRLIQEKLGA